MNEKISFYNEEVPTQIRDSDVHLLKVLYIVVNINSFSALNITVNATVWVEFTDTEDMNLLYLKIFDIENNYKNDGKTCLNKVVN